MTDRRQCMKTDVITLSGNLAGIEQAFAAEEQFAEHYGITGKDARHLRLLSEETICMIHGIFEKFSGQFWLEGEQTADGLLCRICLSAKKKVNREQESQMLSLASSGKNENARGVMGKIREIVRRSLQPANAEEELLMRNMSDAWISTGRAAAPFPQYGDVFWSLKLYRKNVSSERDAKSEEWEDLEKSIIVKIANEVKVWLKSDRTTVVMEKLIPGITDRI